MRLGLLIDCYASGPFSRRRIERLTPENVAVRLLCADTHPDHDSICPFRRVNRALRESRFHQVLEVAARRRVLRVGEVTLAVDGTRLLANASKHSAVSHGRAQRQRVLLEEQIAELLAQADAADSTPLEDGLRVPGESARRQDRSEKLRAATAVIEARARWRVEMDYRELKEELGLDHYEGRHWLGWHHHVTLVSMAFAFLRGEQMRAKKNFWCDLAADPLPAPGSSDTNKHIIPV